MYSTFCSIVCYCISQCVHAVEWSHTSLHFDPFFTLTAWEKQTSTASICCIHGPTVCLHACCNGHVLKKIFMLANACTHTQTGFSKLPTAWCTPCQADTPWQCKVPTYPACKTRWCPVGNNSILKPLVWHVVVLQMQLCFFSWDYQLCTLRFGPVTRITEGDEFKVWHERIKLIKYIIRMEIQYRISDVGINTFLLACATYACTYVTGLCC